MDIDRALFMMDFAHDLDYHDASSQSTYFDCRMDDVIWLYEYDDDA